MGYAIFWIIAAILCAALANRYNRDPGGWFFIGLLSSFAGLALLLCVGPRSAEQKAEQLRLAQTPAKRQANFLGLAVVIILAVSIAIGAVSGR